MDLGKQLHDGQVRLAYYLMTINASAVVLALDKIEQADLRCRLALAVLALASWVVSFCLGVRHLLNKNGALVANIQSLKVEEGTHEVTREHPEIAAEATRRLTARAQEFNSRAKDSAWLQLGFLVAGAVLYAIWLAAEKLG
jgi:hypothetical protein